MKLSTSIFALLLLAVVAPVYGSINVDIYSSYVDNGDSIGFSGLVESFTSDNVQFGTDNSWSWHPNDRYAFGADIKGFIFSDSDTTLPFTLTSDDGSYLFIDGALAISNGTPHSPISVTQPVFLSAGLHSFEVQFFENFGDPSGVDLYFNAEGVHYADSVPEPTAIIVWSLLGVLGMFYGWRKRKSP
jgi:hypothetical protein